MNGRAKDLIGQRFGRLTVIKREGKDKHNRATWLCKCDCGNEKVVNSNNLRNGSTTSCGCLKREMAIKDLTGMKFNRLTVVKEYGRDKSGNVTWLCKCDCGNECVVASTNLQKGDTKSCGCLNKEVHSNNLIGKRFGRLMVIKENGRTKCNKIKWLCKCDCGNECIVIGTNLLKGSSMSCGCLQKEQLIERNINPDLTEEERELNKENRKSNSDFKKWSKEIKEQADYTCDCCGKRGVKLCSHHLNCWDDFKEERYILNNGVCLCEKCHKEFHKWMGGTRIKCTKEDYINFKKQQK